MRLVRSLVAVDIAVIKLFLHLEVVLSTRLPGWSNDLKGFNLWIDDVGGEVFIIVIRPVGWSDSSNIRCTFICRDGNYLPVEGLVKYETSGFIYQIAFRHDPNNVECEFRPMAESWDDAVRLARQPIKKDS